MRNKSKILMLGLVVSLEMVGCGSAGVSTNESSPVDKKIVIAYQHGMAYAPLNIMDKQELFEKYLPDVEIELKELGSGSAMNEGIISGDVDIAMMGVAPYLIGWDKGVPYKIYSAISHQPSGLVTYDSEITSLVDFTKEDKIALPSYGSIQHILLAMAAEKELGDMHAFDEQLINMKHPEGMQTLMTKQEVKGHFTTSPILNKELEIEGYHQVVSGVEAFGGDFTFAVGVAANDFYNNYPELYDGLVQATNEAMEFINENPEKTAEILAEVEGVTPEIMLTYLQADGVDYTSEPCGILEMAQFMQRGEFISKVPTSMDELVFDNDSLK